MEGEKEKRVKEPTEIAKALLKAGANPNLANKVCGNGSNFSSFLIIHSLLVPFQKGGITACMCICTMANTELFPHLIECGIANFRKVNITHVWRYVNTRTESFIGFEF
jgi:hypothetical protein